jgi:hypothetical protein
MRRQCWRRDHLARDTQRSSDIPIGQTRHTDDTRLVRVSKSGASARVGCRSHSLTQSPRLRPRPAPRACSGNARAVRMPVLHTRALRVTHMQPLMYAHCTCRPHTHSQHHTFTHTLTQYPQQRNTTPSPNNQRSHNSPSQQHITTHNITTHNTHTTLPHTRQHTT